MGEKPQERGTNMQEERMTKVQKYAKRKKAMKQARRLATVLCSVMVFCVTYALILPAITLESEGCPYRNTPTVFPATPN